MPLRLFRYKDCDGGCCWRSPRFAKANPTPADMDKKSYLADCRYHLNEPGGTSPDGSTWRGGCAIYKELLKAVEGGKTLTQAALDASSNWSEIAAITKDDENLRDIDPRGGAQWFQTCWVWPVATPTLDAVRTEMVKLGHWDGIEFGFDYVTEYDESEVTWVKNPQTGKAHRSIRGQHFNVEHDWTAKEIADAEPACCHRWEPV